VHSLHEAGAFQAPNAVNYTAKILGVSRATIYNYLNAMEMNKPET
ncbi:MAG: helix-turn-helix domain-containing protein, partial [Candidatus Aminicenantes bacterium]|nr:helix-turn-helix domain-containing protein [Candidatus Aminicenantes bacterium]